MNSKSFAGLLNPPNPNPKPKIKLYHSLGVGLDVYLNCCFVIQLLFVLSTVVAMNRAANQMNILLICLNIIGLGNYLFIRMVSTEQYEYILIIYIVSIISIEKYIKKIKIHFCLIASLAVLSTFVKQQSLDLLFVSVSLAIAVNLGYFLLNQAEDQMKIKLYELALNLSLSVAILCSLLSNYIQISRISSKIIILVTTLPNFYLSLPGQIAKQDQFEQNRGSKRELSSKQPNRLIGSKLIYYLNPLYCKSWAYAVGYSIGIYINIFGIISISKYIKYLIVSLLILIEALTYNQIIRMICIFMRAILIFHFERLYHTYERYFVFVYLVLKNVLSEDALNIYLIFGYSIISMTFWREEYYIDKDIQINNDIKSPLAYRSSQIEDCQDSHFKSEAEIGHKSYIHDNSKFMRKMPKMNEAPED